jgi:hypothetical protein
MAEYEQIMQALRAAHAAGDTEAARRLARMASGASTAQSPDPRRQGVFADAERAGWQLTTPGADMSDQIEAPEGVVRVPGTGQYTTREMMAGAMQPGRAGAALAGAAHGITMGGIDEIAGGLGAIVGQGDYQRERARARIDAARRDFPGATLTGELAGAVAVPMPGAAAMQGASLPVRMAAGAGAGAGFGAQYGFMTGEGVQDRAQGALTGALVGGAAGAAVPALVQGARNVAQHVAAGRAIDSAAKTAPTTEALRAQSAAIYEAAQSRGITLRGDSFKSFADDIVALAKAEGADPDVTSAAWGAVRRLAAASHGVKKGGDISFRRLDTLRKIANNASTSNNPADRRIAGMIVEGIDDYVARLVDSDVAAGSAKGLSAELAEARKLWRAMRTSEALETAVERARDQASGFENGIRIQFRQLLGNKKFARGLSEGEREAMRAVVRGTPVGNVLKRLSRMSFGSGAQTNFMGASLTSGMGAAVGSAFGPVGAAAGAVIPPVIGAVAGRGAEATTARMAERARAVAAGGGLALPGPPALNALRGALQQGAQGVLPAYEAVRR